MEPSSDPRSVYERRLAERTRELAHAQAADDRLVRARQVLLAAMAGLAWLVFRTHALGPGWLVLAAAAFGGLAVWHGRVARDRRIAERRVAFYERGLARLDGRWAGQGTPGEAWLDHDHPYAADLDLFGPGSLFELLCTARTHAGEAKLAAWLLAPASPAEVRVRQEAVRELAPRLDLREDLALLGEDIRSGVHPDRVAAWGRAPLLRPHPAVRWMAALLALAAATTLGLWIADLVGPWPFLLVAAGELAIALPLRTRIAHVVRAVDMPGHELALLSDLLARIERESFNAATLAGLQRGLETAGAPPSRRIAHLRRLISLLDARRNQIFAPVSGVLLWATQFGCAIEAWRAESGPAIGTWFTAVGEFEALSALAGYAFEHPDDVFPAVAAEPGVARFDGAALGHPLLPRDTNVRNDVSLSSSGGEAPAVLVVSGSNMSGKSTLLRTVGVNAVLALAGAPVRAASLRMTPLAIGATLRIQDSLQGGRSRFYAEVTRLRAIVDLAQRDLPALFLLDELLNGTNSHDRRAGAEALVRGLVAHGAIGLLTTHDLALAEIAAALAPQAANVHFEDHLEGGQMAFDYRCRPGTVTRSNALALMRAVGLDV